MNGRWIAEGETEEGSTTLPTLIFVGEMLPHLSRPRLRSATLPSGEGLGKQFLIPLRNSNKIPNCLLYIPFVFVII